MLTIHSRDLAASRAAGKSLAKGEVRSGAQKGVRKVWFEDTYGNTFIVEETKP